MSETERRPDWRSNIMHYALGSLPFLACRILNEMCIRPVVCRLFVVVSYVCVCAVLLFWTIVSFGTHSDSLERLCTANSYL